MSAASHADSQAVVFEDIDISAFLNKLRVGDNVLAIQAINTSTGSGDFLILPELTEGIVSQGGGPIPLAQAGYPKLDLAAIEFNPASGNQDEEYLQLLNSNNVAVDLSGWRLEGGIQWQFPPGTVLPAGWSLYVTPNAKAFRRTPPAREAVKGCSFRAITTAICPTSVRRSHCRPPMARSSRRGLTRVTRRISSNSCGSPRSCITRCRPASTRRR